MAKNRKKNHRGQDGFSLVELLVSIMIFALGMGIVLQLFVFSLRSQRALLTHSQLINEMSYNMEHMSRGLRMAQKSADSACLSAQNLNYEQTTHINGSVTTYGVKFLQPTAALGINECVEYYRGHPADYPAGTSALMESRWNAAGILLFDLPLTSPDINVLDFTVAGAGWSQSDSAQPRVTLHVKTQGSGNEILDTQTTVSQRNMDVIE